MCGYGSTGRIAAELYENILSHGDSCKIAYGRGNAPENIDTIRVGSDCSVNLHGIFSRLTDRQGFYSKRATEELVRQARQWNPDIIHLHNLHGYYLHLPTLFEWLSSQDRPVVWTLHDCWAFTGHCAYFDFVSCDRWKDICHDCPQKKEYPSSLLLDSSQKNYLEKKKLFTSVKNMTLVCPSQWLSGLVRESFLGCYPVKTILNGIDLDKFRPTDGSFRRTHGLEHKKIALGVASVWERRKGLFFFPKLEHLLGDDWKIVLVGVTSEQKQELPSSILSFPRTNSIKELAALYTTADVFVNPTLEDNFPTTNLEALACGTPVATFDTGGSPEAITPLCGVCIPKGNLERLSAGILSLQRAESAACRERSLLFDKTAASQAYYSLYHSMLGE